MKIGITGHQKLSSESLWDWVKTELDVLLKNFSDDLIGVSSLAIGADQLFADAVLEHQGKLQVIVPFDGYELKFSRGKDRENYFRLLNKAELIDVLGKEDGYSEEDSFFAAGKKVVDTSDLLIAVWDGKPAAGLGGTGDVVQYAIRHKKQIFYINPITKEVIEK
jgi:hypothetical protein